MRKKLVVILVLLMISAAYAATRSLVPRADGEGGLGTSSKNWLEAYIDTIFTDVVTFTDNNASPDAVGELLYDNTVAGIDDGWFCWYDDDEIKYLVDTNTLPTDSEDDYHLAYDKDTDKLYWKADADSGGATAWDNITNPDANDEIDFGSYVIELNVANFQIGDGGANYVDFDGTPTVTFAGNADIDLPENSVDLADLAAAAYAKDLVTTAPITGAADNIFVGADSDVTVALTLLKDIVTTAPITGGEDDVLPGADADLTIAITLAKDLVTTAPLTGGTDNIFPGADADITVAIPVATTDANGYLDQDDWDTFNGKMAGTLLKDLVTTAPITGGTDNIFPGADADITVALTLLKDLVTTAPVTGAADDIFPGADADITVALDFTAAWDFSGATLTMPSRTANDDRYFAFNAWNPNALYDTDTQICIEPNLPAAITITEVTITCDADPTTELDWDLKWADAFIGLGNAALIVAIDTTSGTTNISSGFDDATVVAGKCIYVEFGADPDSNIKQAMVKIKYDYD